MCEIPAASAAKQKKTPPTVEAPPNQPPAWRQITSNGQFRLLPSMKESFRAECASVLLFKAIGNHVNLRFQK